MTLIKLTPQQAATRANVSRGTIMNAIKDGNLSAMRDNRNRWQISADQLAKWLSDRTDNISDKPVTNNTIELPPPDRNAIRVAVLEAELKGKDQRIADLERDRDSWKEQAQELARRPLEPIPPAPVKRRRWWPF